MPRKVAIHFSPLKSCLVNLPISMYGPLVEHAVRPQNIAIHLSTPATASTSYKECYVGWTGMASASSLAQWQSQKSRREGSFETLEIDPQFATALGLSEGQVVEIGVLHDLPVAKSISTEPLTVDDWEILELHAGYVEDNLLTQVRAAFIGQEIDVWVLGRTRIRFRVVTTDPPSTRKAVLLSTNTEVSIAPKSRTQQKKPLLKDPPKASKPTESPKPSSHDFHPSIQSTVLRMIPSRLANVLGGVSNPDGTPVLYVSPSTLSSLVPDFSSSSSYNATVRRLPPPSISGIPTSKTPANNASSLTPLAPKILQPKDGAQAQSSVASPPTERLEEEVTLQCLPDLPSQHALVQGQLQTAGILDWDIASVTITSTKGTALSSDPEKGHLRTHFTPTPTSELAGVDSILDNMTSFIFRSFILQASQALSVAGLPVSSKIPALLLCGSPGSGKTSMVREIVKRVENDQKLLTHHLYIDLARYSEERVLTLKTLFEKWLDIAVWHKPSILILDNLDRVIGPEVEHADSSRQRQIAEQFISVLSSFARTSSSQGVVIICTSQSQTTLHPLLNTTHVFADRLTVRAPGKDARRDILARLVSRQLSTSDLSQDPASPLNYVSLATQTEGYSASDLRDLLGRAIHQAAIRSIGSENIDNDKPTLRTEDFAAAQVDFTPLSLRDVKLQKSDIEWSDIGGLHETRRVLRETLEWPTKYGAIFAKCPIRLRSGLLLYGYPGCGKTLLASAVAKECGLNFISVKGPELLNKYIGASEKSVRDLFERATAAKPCVLFFDEFDSIAPKRGHDSTGVTDRVVNQMLTQMDGAEGLDGVYVLAATSRPDLIDPALLRPGRLDKSLLCSMPDAEERAEIINALRRKVTLADDVDVSQLARLTEGYSGADLQALVYNAHLNAVHASISEHLQSDETVGSSNSTAAATPSFVSFGGPVGEGVLSKAEEAVRTKRMEAIMDSLNPKRARNAKSGGSVKTKAKPIVNNHHLHESLSSTRPSVSPEERYRLSRIYAAFVGDRNGDLPLPPESTAVGMRASLG